MLTVPQVATSSSLWDIAENTSEFAETWMVHLRRPSDNVETAASDELELCAERSKRQIA